MLLLVSTTLVGSANSEVLATNGILKKPAPVVTPDSLPERYREIVPTPAPTPTPELSSNPTRRLLTSAKEVTPIEKPVESDLKNLLEQLHRQKEFTVADSLRALKQATPQVRCTVFYEAGGGKMEYGFNPYDPYILDGPDVEGALNFGIGQLAPKGKLPEFFKSFKNPFNPYEVVSYMNRAFANGQMFHWGPVALGLC